MLAPPTAPPPQPILEKTVRPYELVFPDFMRDKERFGLAEAYWKVVLGRCIDHARGDRDDWTIPWRYNPLRDGTDILTAVNRKLRRAVRVHHYAPNGLTPEQESWFDLEGEARSPAHLHILTIAITPCRRTVQAATGLMVGWVRGDMIATNDYA